MARRLNDWLSAFCDYSSFGEAPRRMYFWCGVSAIAGALRRRVWIDQTYFQWYPNLYIVLVAPPGIVGKSTTADVAMSLLRQVPNIRFGPSVVTWQALVALFKEAHDSFAIDGVYYFMSPMTISSSEFGNLLNPKDKEMVDMLVHLWDGKPFIKATKMSGTDEVINPWINIIACTTPEWIAGSFPEYMVGGGFTSRCLFVYASNKHQYVPYPADVVPPTIKTQEEDLVHDLEWISAKICGQYTIADNAKAWGSDWYIRHYTNDAQHMDSSRFGGYIARKQTMAHKIAMILAASQRDELIILKEDLETAVNMLTDLEGDMHKVFEKIGMQNGSIHLDRLVQMIQRRGKVPYVEVYRWMQRYFPKKSEIEDVLLSAQNGGYIQLQQQENSYFYVALRDV